MTIVIVSRSTEYGKQRKDGSVSPLQITGNTDEAFAHSMDDAKRWVQSLPLFTDATIIDPGDGRIFYQSRWIPADWTWVLDPDLLEAQATHQRIVIGIADRNTIFESVGYEMFRLTPANPPTGPGLQTGPKETP